MILSEVMAPHPSWRDANRQELATDQLTIGGDRGEILLMRERSTVTGDRLRRTRIALGYDQAIDFARELSVDKGDYSKFERGKKAIPLTLGLKLKEGWNVPLDWTFCGDAAQIAPDFYQKIIKVPRAA